MQAQGPPGWGPVPQRRWRTSLFARLWRLPWHHLLWRLDVNGVPWAGGHGLAPDGPRMRPRLGTCCSPALTRLRALRPGKTIAFGPVPWGSPCGRSCSGTSRSLCFAITFGWSWLPWGFSSRCMWDVVALAALSATGSTRGRRGTTEAAWPVQGASAGSTSRRKGLLQLLGVYGLHAALCRGWSALSAWALALTHLTSHSMAHSSTPHHHHHYTALTWRAAPRDKLTRSESQQVLVTRLMACYHV